MRSNQLWSALVAITIAIGFVSRASVADERDLSKILRAELFNQTTSASEHVFNAAVIVVAKPVSAEDDAGLKARCQAFGLTSTVQDIALLLRKSITTARIEGRVEFVSVSIRAPIPRFAGRVVQKENATTAVNLATQEDVENAPSMENLWEAFSRKGQTITGNSIIWSQSYQGQEVLISSEELLTNKSRDIVLQIHRKSPHSATVTFLSREPDGTMKSACTTLVHDAKEWKLK